MVQVLNLVVLPIGFLAMSYMYQIFQFFINEMLDNHKQTSRPYYQNHMRSILQSIDYVEDSRKLLKGRLVKPQRHILDLNSPSAFKKNYKAVLRTVTLPKTTLVFKKILSKN